MEKEISGMPQELRAKLYRMLSGLEFVEVSFLAISVNRFPEDVVDVLLDLMKDSE